MFLTFNLASIVLPALLGLGVLGIVFGVILAIAAKKFHVRIDPRVEEIAESLPGANCGACGCPGCLGYAEALVKGKVGPNLCAPGGAEVAHMVARILGIEAVVTERQVALIHCAGGEKCLPKYRYSGIQTCKAATMIAGGNIGCNYGCLRYYDCIESCRFDAIETREDGLPVINPEACVACGACVQACPKNLIELISDTKKVHILCNNPEKGKAVTSVCKIGCIGCTHCVKACPEEAIQMHNGLAKIDYSKCQNCAECAKVCPVNVIYDFNKQDPITWLPPISEIYPKPKKKAAEKSSPKE
jgi:H+/Na+-translocating ferredoxin:NAD+ oxidoreductase subunit B